MASSKKDLDAAINQFFTGADAREGDVEDATMKYISAEPEPVPEQAGPAGEADIPEGCEALADMKGMKPARKNAKQPKAKTIVSVRRYIGRGDDEDEEDEDEGSGLSYYRQGPGAAERKAEAREKTEKTKEESKEWKSARDALREAGAPRSISRIVYKDGEAKTKHYQILMQPSLFEALREAADEDGVSINEYINQAVREKILNS